MVPGYSLIWTHNPRCSSLIWTQDGLKAVLNYGEAVSAVAECEFAAPVMDISVWSFLNSICTNAVDTTAGTKRGHALVVEAWLTPYSTPI